MSIRSRYSLTNINPNNYAALSISGCTSGSTPTLVGTKSGLEQGYVWVPYIMMSTTGIVNEDSEMLRRMRIEHKRAQRKEKLKKLNW